MLGVQAARGGEAPADGADRERGAAQHPKSGIAERGDALGMKVLSQHVAKDLPDLIDGEPLLPDDHDIPRPGVAGREICWRARGWKSSGRFRKDAPLATSRRFLSESPLRLPDSFMSRAE